MKPSILALCAALLALTSCAAPNFNSRYEAAKAASAPAYAGITGPWEGTWKSGANGHEGELKCIVSEGKKPDEYKFLYWATWGHGMKGTFKFQGTAEEEDGAVQVTGSKRLGPAKYHHEATITGSTFMADFGSDKKNFGHMTLERPE